MFLSRSFSSCLVRSRAIHFRSSHPSDCATGFCRNGKSCLSNKPSRRWKLNLEELKPFVRHVNVEFFQAITFTQDYRVVFNTTILQQIRISVINQEVSKTLDVVTDTNEKYRDVFPSSCPHNLLTMRWHSRIPVTPELILFKSSPPVPYKSCNNLDMRQIWWCVWWRCQIWTFNTTMIPNFSDSLLLLPEAF